MKYTDDQLIERVESHAEDFVGWRQGIYDIWVRSSADITDAFDDKVYTFIVYQNGERPEFRMVCTGTSHAGSYGLRHFEDYDRPEGCAVLEADRIVYNSHRPGYHKRYRAYVQSKGFPYRRDNNRNGKIDPRGPVHDDIITANCHRAAAVGESTRIYNWSVGCLVRNKANQWNAWLAYMDNRPLSVAILNEF